MYFGYSLPEFAVFTVAALIVIWALWRIFSSGRLSSNFVFWFIIFATIFSLWAWRSGTAVYYYEKIKTEIATPDFE